PVPFDAQSMQAPHVVVTVFARGLLNHVVTRLYFEDEATNETDPILRRVPKERRDTLLAKRWPSDRKVAYQFDIVLQGKRETVFFDL
ncbi:MAG TPA: protocatechuate 3,4-dioxygenase subunit alpha, partial [Chloroflexota bacterium]|nr:protocatechuate 3,4-dioxygenase subunit alpha [Chloroflexota bacterium]